jgi:RimJ/RimL family protein N-acetyltransferase
LLNEQVIDMTTSLPSTPTLETPRLILRPLALADAEEVQPLFAQWEIVRHLNARVPWPFPPDGVRTYYLDSALPAIERGEQWHWMLHLKDDPAKKIIGSICLVLRGPVNRGFWIALPWQGQGLMTEAVNAVNRFWFEELKQPILRTKKACENAASRAISLREGMRCVDKTEDDYVSGRLPTEHWEFTAEDWHQRNPR